MAHHSQNSVRQLELSWKLFLVYLLSIWSVSMGDFWVLRRWGFCVWGDKRRRGGGEAAIIWLTCLNMSIWITIQSGWNENWSDDAYCVLRLARLSFSFLVNVYTDQAPHQWNWIFFVSIILVDLTVFKWPHLLNIEQERWARDQPFSNWMNDECFRRTMCGQKRNVEKERDTERQHCDIAVQTLQNQYGFISFYRNSWPPPFSGSLISRYSLINDVNVWWWY